MRPVVTESATVPVSPMSANVPAYVKVVIRMTAPAIVLATKMTLAVRMTLPRRLVASSEG